MKISRSFRAAVLAGFACLSFQFLVLESNAGIITLTDGNSSASIDPSSQAGMFNWSVDGQNQLNQQWFWYRVGNAPEQSIDTIGAPTVSQPDAKTLYTKYSNGIFSVEVDYSLNGSSPASGISDIGELIRIRNFTAEPLDFHFFQYSDFDLLDTPGGETVQLGKNLGGKFNEALQVKGTLGITETVAAPGANHGEVALFAATLNKLNDTVADNLNGNAGPVGPGDVTWALQWDVVIPANGTVLISKDKYLSVVPEPSTFVLLGGGAVGLLAFVWRRRKASR